MRIRAKPMRIRSRVRLCCLKKMDFDMKNMLNVGNMSLKTYLRRYKAILKGWISGLYICYSWAFSLLLDPDPHSLYGSLWSWRSRAGLPSTSSGTDPNPPLSRNSGGSKLSRGKPWTLTMEAWRLKMERLRACKPGAADAHNFDEGQDPDPH